MADRVFNVCVIGYGLSAKVFHIPFVAATNNLQLHSIVQRKPYEGNSAPNDHPEVKHYTSFDSALQDPELDLVVLSTPPNTHFDQTKRAIEAGKHVLTEKPFVPTSAEAEELVKLAKEKNKLLCVYQNRRWDADFLTVQHLLQEGRLGRIHEFETHFDRYRPDGPRSWKSTLSMADGNGAIYDLGTHLLDQVYVLFGKPTAAYGKFINQREGRLVSGANGLEDEPDSIHATLTYADKGLLVHVRIGVLSAESKQPRFWVRGSKGSYHKTGLDAQEPQLIGGMKISDTGFGVDGAAYNGTIDIVQEDGSIQDFTFPNVQPQTYLRFYELLAGALVSGKQEDLPVPAQEAAEVLKIIEALKESARAGKEVSVA
ncbi:oxidoreductase domain-containing protein [Diaporthe sp. PMI_573]|nr:oxidoreductase domain-containing protein [Diaporthaceae sp. PMI_573]